MLVLGVSSYNLAVAKKRLFKIGDACREVDIQPYVLRYWETEFPFLKPGKSRAGPRVYSEDELDLVRRIKVLLYEEGYTIAGAKKKLEADLKAGVPASSGPLTNPAASSEGDAELVTRVDRLETGVREALTQTQALLRRL